MNGILGLITARGGSKGLPDKNIAELGGAPLIAWSIAAARSSRTITRLVVSTNDENIASVARAAGADVPFMRPAELATDAAPHILAVEHALRWLEEREGFRPERVMLLQPTSPFRTAADIDAAVALAGERDADAVVSVCLAKPHPLLTYQLASDGTLAEFVPGGGEYRRRQDLPSVVAPNGAIYLNRREVLLRDRTFVPAGAVPYLMPPERSLDIDTAWDLMVAECCVRAGLVRAEPGVAGPGAWA